MTARRRAVATDRELPVIALVQAGGTMVSLGTDRLDHSAYGDTTTRLSAEELLQRCPEVREMTRVVARDVRTGGSRTLVPEDWIDLSLTVREEFASSVCDGVVISHGTNSLEETAFFLDLTVDDHRPVVVVGAMRPPNTMGTDAELNLLNAFRVAMAPSARGRGVLVVMDSVILSARDATKTSTYGLGSFSGRDWGPLGVVGADGVIVWSRRASSSENSSSTFDLKPGCDLPRVDILVSHVGADGRLVNAAVRLGAKGLVCAGTGAGVVTVAEENALLGAVRHGVTVCLSSRVSAGYVHRTPAMTRNGFIAAGDLPPWKARILLSLALNQGWNHAAIQERFAVA